MKKSQVSIEFMFVIGIIFVIFLILSVFIFERKIELINTEKYLNKRDECFKFSNLINSVFTGGHGTNVKTRTIYMISVYNTSIITVEELENDTVIPESEVACNFNAEILDIYQLTGDIIIENENNFIILKNDYCPGTDISCGCDSCINCNTEGTGAGITGDGCYESSYIDYYCSGTSCTYTSDDCSDCTCTCGDYGKESETGYCNDSLDNDCNDLTDCADPVCDGQICAPGKKCISGICDTPKSNGESCTDPSECQSDLCVDGVCCNSECTGSLCQRCDSYSINGAGNCGYVISSQDPDNECTQGSTTTDGCRSNYCSGGGYSCGVQSTGDGGCPQCQKCTDGDIACEYYAHNTDDGCGLCKNCDGAGSCHNQADGEDYQNECTAYDCANLIKGWSGNSCQRYTGADFDNGYCNGAGACNILSDACTGAATTASCGSAGCKKACPAGGAKTSYDSVSEVCYTSGQNNCSGDGICDSTGTCIYSGCADGTAEYNFNSGIVRCAGAVLHSNRESLCGAGWSTCTVAEWIAYGGPVDSLYTGSWLQETGYSITVDGCAPSSCQSDDLHETGGNRPAFASYQTRNWGACNTCRYVSSSSTTATRGTICCKD